MDRTFRSRESGLSILEITLVVSILGITALAIIPHLASTDPYRLEYVAQQVEQALRFARSESIRTGDPHGVLIDGDNSEVGGDISVYRVNPAGTLMDLTYLSYHPISKQPYNLRLNNSDLSRDVRLAAAGNPFVYRGVAGKKKYVHFDSTGMPVRVNKAFVRRLTSGEIVLAYGEQSLTVSVSPITGRVQIK